MVARALASFLAAIGFFTVLPAPGAERLRPGRTADAMVWLPAVGFLLGGVLALVDLGLRAVFPPWAGAALLLAAWTTLTGALHLDGFLDACDGLLAARPPRDRLEILRDPHAGSFAVVGGICLLAAKFASLAELPAADRTLALLVVPALARGAVVFAVRAFPYARAGSGLGRLFRDGLSWSRVAAAAAVAIGAATIVLGWIGAATAGFVWLAATLLGWWSTRRIGGLTGDVYGAVVEVGEVGALLFVLAVGGG